jgi:hypothetical protein
MNADLVEAKLKNQAIKSDCSFKEQVPIVWSG